MLSEEDKARVRAEEIYRDEVRNELNLSQQSVPRLKRFARAINKPITIWFLSAIIAAGWSQYLTTFFEHLKSERNRIETAEKIREEIVVRCVPTAINTAMDLKYLEFQLMRIRHIFPRDMSVMDIIGDKEKKQKLTEFRAKNAQGYANKFIEILDRLEAAWAQSEKRYAHAAFSGQSAVGLLVQYERLSDAPPFGINSIQLIDVIGSVNMMEDAKRAWSWQKTETAEDIDRDEYTSRMFETIERTESVLNTFEQFNRGIIAVASHKAFSKAYEERRHRATTMTDTYF